MRCLFHHGTRQADGVARVRDIGNCAGVQSGAVHDSGVHLVAAISSKYCAAARVEKRVIFKNVDRRFDGIEGRAALVKHLCTGFDRLVEPGAILAVGFGRHLRALDDTRAAVNDDGPVMRRLLRPSGGARQRQERYVDYAT